MLCYMSVWYMPISHLSDLLYAFVSLIITAKEQAVVQQRIDILNNELDKKNGEILSLQKNLKEAETLLVSPKHYEIGRAPCRERV